METSGEEEHEKLLFAALWMTLGAVSHAESTTPNVLWILTDDHHHDSIRAVNKMLPAREMSELG